MQTLDPCMLLLSKLAQHWLPWRGGHFGICPRPSQKPQNPDSGASQEPCRPLYASILFSSSLLKLPHLQLLHQGLLRQLLLHLLLHHLLLQRHLLLQQLRLTESGLLPRSL